MFMWNTSKNDLFLPITLKVSDSIDTYKTIDFFQGLISINIDKNT
ncbi:MAG: hypothetical protein P1U46_00580 [Patescibacteria group bacterium]|nr:hypothetical protein [Patescibacteria group bacterium]